MLSVDLVTVQGHARFQAQGVPGGEANGAHSSGFPSLQQPSPDAGGLFVGEVQLVAVLARVARATDARAREAADAAEGELVVAELVEIAVRRHRLEHFEGGGALQGDHRFARRAMVDLNIEALFVGVHPLEHRVRVGSVDHQVDLVLTAVDEQIVDRVAVCFAKQRVADRAHGNASHVVRRDAVQVADRVRAGHREPSHVPQVEETGLGAHTLGFFQDRAVLDRHVPATKIDHLGAEGFVNVVQGSLFHDGNAARAAGV